METAVHIFQFCVVFGVTVYAFCASADYYREENYSLFVISLLTAFAGCIASVTLGMSLIYFIGR